MIRWLHQRLSRKQKRRHARRGTAHRLADPRRPAVEPLESRRLLTVSADCTGGVLSVTMDGVGDKAVIFEDMYQDVQVRDQNGMLVVEGTAASGITAINVTSTGTNDTTDLTQVGASTGFTSLATIDVGAGVGASVLLSGSYHTTGNQTYSAAVTLQGNTALFSGGAIDFGSTVDGGFTLTNNTTNGVTFGGAVGGATELTGLYVYSGAADLNGGGAHTTNTQGYYGAVTLTANTALTSVAGDITFYGTLDGAYSLATSAAGKTAFFGTVGGATSLTSLTTSGAGQTEIGAAINTSGAQSYLQDVLLAGVNQGDVFTLTTQGGDVTFAGTIDSFEIPDPQFTLIVNTNGAGTTAFGGAVGATMALDDLTVTSGAIDLNGGTVQTVGTQTYNAPVVLTADTTLTSTGGGNIAFSQTLDSNANGPFSLTVNTAGNTLFGGLVGGSHPLAALTTDAPGATAINGGGVTTTGGQSYNDDVILGSAATVLTSTTAGGAVTFGGTLDGGSALSVNTSGGITTFNGAVGATTALTSLETNGGATKINGASVTTTGSQTYNDAVTLGANPPAVSLNAAGDIMFNSTLDGLVSLTVNTFGTTSFNGAVGATTALDSLTTGAVGTTAINGPSITTLGTQIYNDNVTLGAAATALLSNGGAVIQFSQKVDGAANLTVTSAGSIVFDDAVGSAAPLSSLTTNGIGVTQLAANVTTTGNQVYNQFVALIGNVVMQGDNILFAGGVDSQAGSQGTQYSLSIAATGTTKFDGSVGAQVGLSSLSATSSAIDLNGGTVRTSGAQSYNGPTLLTTNTTLVSDSGGNITFSDTLDSAASVTPYSLNVNTAGTTTFGGLVGGNQALASLITDSPGTTAINGGGVTTTGAQFYLDAVTLGSPSTLLTSTGGSAISFSQSLDGESALSTNTTGVTIFAGSVGAAIPLNSLSINSGNASLSGPVSTIGNQSYQGDVSLEDDVTLTTHAGNVAFGGRIDSSIGDTTTTFALTIDTTAGGAAPAGGLVTFAGAIGSIAPLGMFTVTAAGPLTLAHGITTVGNQLFTVVPSSSAANGLTVAAGGALSSQGAVELRSGGNLAIAAGGGITANGITLRGDFNNPNSAAAVTMLLAGNLQSPAAAVFTGNGTTTVNMQRTLANTTTTIIGGTGTDFYNLSSAAPALNGVLSTLAGGIAINGGTGANTLRLGDAGDLPGLAGTLTSNSITGFGMPNTIGYSKLQNLIFQLSTGPDETLYIGGTAAGSAAAVNGGHLVSVSGGPGGLDSILGSLAINGASLVDLYDRLSTTAHTYDLTSNYFLRSDGGASSMGVVQSTVLPGQVGIALTNVQNTIIDGGTAKNVYNVFLPLASGQTVTIQGGGGGNYLNVVGSAAGPNTAYVGDLGSGDPIQIGGVDCLTMYGAVNQPNVFVNQTAVKSILIGGMANDTLMGGSGANVLFGGGGNDFLMAGAGSSGNYVFANMLPAYLPNGMLNPNVGNGTIYPGLPGSSTIAGGNGVVVYFGRGSTIYDASKVLMMDCDVAASRALLQSLFNQALAGNECLAMLTSPPAPPDPPMSQAMSVSYAPYVQRAYQDILGRAADQTGLSFWTAQLAAGLSRATFANALTHSDEYYQRIVAADYQAYLIRPVDSASLAFWINQFEHGLSDQLFESVLLGSDEFYQRFGDNTAWIDAVYQALLGRSADSPSEAYWNSQLQDGVSRQTIAYWIATSPEAFARVVNTDYQQILGRAPGTAEVNYWVGQLQGGASNESVLASFVASDEFASIS